MLVAFGEHELAVVPQREIDRLRKLGNGSDILPPPVKPEPFKTGTRVHVGGYGPLAGHDAVYQEIATEGKVRLIFDWMGRLVPIDVDQRDVRAETRIENEKKRRTKRRRGRNVKTMVPIDVDQRDVRAETRIENEKKRRTKRRRGRNVKTSV